MAVPKLRLKQAREKGFVFFEAISGGTDGLIAVPVDTFGELLGRKEDMLAKMSIDEVNTVLIDGRKLKRRSGRGIGRAAEDREEGFGRTHALESSSESFTEKVSTREKRRINTAKHTLERDERKKKRRRKKDLVEVDKQDVRGKGLEALETEDKRNRGVECLDHGAREERNERALPDKGLEEGDQTHNKGRQRAELLADHDHLREIILEEERERERKRERERVRYVKEERESE